MGARLTSMARRACEAQISMLTAQAPNLHAAEGIHAKVDEVVEPEDIITMGGSMILEESRTNCPGICMCAGRLLYEKMRVRHKIGRGPDPTGAQKLACGKQFCMRDLWSANHSSPVFRLLFHFLDFNSSNN
jgi:hypothetical protein